MRWVCVKGMTWPENKIQISVNTLLIIDSYVVLLCVHYRLEEIILYVLECKFHMSCSGRLRCVKVDVAGSSFNLGEKNA